MLSRQAALRLLALLLWPALTTAQRPDTTNAARDSTPKHATIHVELDLLPEAVVWWQNQANKDAIGTLSPDAAMRLNRISLFGELPPGRTFTYKVVVDVNDLAHASETKRITVRDLWLRIPITDAIGMVTIGRQKEGVLYQLLVSATDRFFTERATNVAFVDTRNDGLRFSNHVLDDRMTWSLGAFNDHIISHVPWDSTTSELSARTTWLPLPGDSGRALVHLGLNVRLTWTDAGTLRYRSKPEVNEGPNVIDTDTIPTSLAQMYGIELGFGHGRVGVVTELTANRVAGAQNGALWFGGGYVSASWFLTNDHRNYKRDVGYLGRATVHNPIARHTGGHGAWEISARYSNTNLSANDVDGGRFGRASFAINWYATERWRLESDYGFGWLKRKGVASTLQSLQWRLQFAPELW